MNHSTNATDSQFCGRTRREMLLQTGGGFTGVALASMLGSQFFSAAANIQEFLGSIS